LKSCQLCSYPRENGIGSDKYQPVSGKEKLAASQDALAARPEQLKNEISAIKSCQFGLEETTTDTLDRQMKRITAEASHRISVVSSR
jgi:hypothetical protein